MGYYISAYDKDENEIAILRVFPGGIVMTREVGYDWFKLINASECDAGVSGSAIEKNIKLVELQNAVEILTNYGIKEKLTEFNPNSLRSLQELWISQKTEFIRFMNICIKWCISNNKKKIKVGFY